MPLIILGLIVTVGIIIYALVRYANSDDRIDMDPVRERFSNAFDRMKENINRGANYEVVDDDDDDDTAEDGQSVDSGRTMHFPDDAEVEKRKRNIH